MPNCLCSHDTAYYILSPNHGTVAHAWGTDNANKWGVTANASMDVTMATIGLVGDLWVVSGAYFLGHVMGLWDIWGDEH